MKVLTFINTIGKRINLEKEYDNIHNLLERILGFKVICERNVDPSRLSERIFDMYIMDGSSFIDFTEFHKQVKENPRSLFVIWSPFIGMKYKEWIREKFDHIITELNVVLFNGSNKQEILNWTNKYPTSPIVLRKPAIRKVS